MPPKGEWDCRLKGDRRSGLRTSGHPLDKIYGVVEVPRAEAAEIAHEESMEDSKKRILPADVFCYYTKPRTWVF
jgi:hypothetical protein